MLGSRYAPPSEEVGFLAILFVGLLLCVVMGILGGKKDD